MFFVRRSTYNKLATELRRMRDTATRQMMRIELLERENRQLRSQAGLPPPGTKLPPDSPTSVPPSSRDMQAWRTVRPTINRESTRHERVVEHRTVDDGFVPGMTTGMIAQSMMTPSPASSRSYEPEPERYAPSPPPPPSPPSYSSYDSGSSPSSDSSPAPSSSD